MAFQYLDKLKGKVKFIIESNSRMGQDTLSAELVSYHYKNIDEYAKKGNVIKSSSYLNGNLEDYTIKMYNNNGRIIEDYCYHEDGSCFQNSNWIYDQEGKLVQYIRFRGGSEDLRLIYDYDTDGNLIKLTTCLDDTIEDYSTFIYDDKGKLIEEKWYESCGQLIEDKKFQYNVNGDLFLSDRYCYSPYYTFYRNTYNYDERGNLIEFNSYDLTNNGLETTDNLINKYTYLYELDEIGNWIRKTELKCGKVNEIIDREIIYFLE